MSDEQIADLLSSAAGAPRAPGELPPLPPLPVAQVADARALPPAPVLGYADRKDRDAHYSDPRLLAELPVAFRVLRVAPWVLVALFMLYAMLSKIISP